MSQSGLYDYVISQTGLGDNLCWQRRLHQGLRLGGGWGGRAHVVTLAAAVDNRLEPEDLPLAPWWY